MAVTANSINRPLSFVKNLSDNAIHELESHPAFYSILNTEDAEKLLAGTPPMTYILWTDKMEVDTVEQYFLSYMETDLKVEHRTFSHPKDWFYMNCDPHSADNLSDLIPQIMHCKPAECKMLVNPDDQRLQK